MFSKPINKLAMAPFESWNFRNAVAFVGFLSVFGSLGFGLNVALKPKWSWAESSVTSEFGDVRPIPRVEVIVTPQRDVWRVRSSHWQSLLSHPLVKEKKHLFTIRERQLMVRAGIYKIPFSRKIWLKDRFALRKLQDWVEDNQLPFDFSIQRQKE